MSHRPERVASLIGEELSKIILREVEFPGSLMTITGVEVDSKLERAIVKFSVLPSENFAKVLKILGKSSSHLQYLLMKKTNIKPMPKIIFEMDRGLEKAAEVEKLLLENKIEE